MNAGIYKIQSPSGRFYIGSSVNVRRRLNTHKRDLRKQAHINDALQNAANKYGVDALTYEVIACPLNIAHLRELEQTILDDRRPEYNISKVAECALFDGATITKRIKAIQKPVVRVTDGVVFQSGYEAARHHGVSNPDNLSTALRNRWRFAGHFWKWLDDETSLQEFLEIEKRRNCVRKEKAKAAAIRARSKPVIRLIDGMIFPSAAAASLAVGGHKKMISEAICMGVVRAGSRWQYV